MVLWCWKIGAAIVVEGVALRRRVLENARMIMFRGGWLPQKIEDKSNLSSRPVPSHEPDV